MMIDVNEMERIKVEIAVSYYHIESLELVTIFFSQTQLDECERSVNRLVISGRKRRGERSNWKRSEIVWMKRIQGSKSFASSDLARK
jgi:hypothetical protein